VLQPGFFVFVVQFFFVFYCGVAAIFQKHDTSSSSKKTFPWALDDFFCCAKKMRFSAYQLTCSLSSGVVKALRRMLGAGNLVPYF